MPRPTWRRKPDGRPYINYVINGKRYRTSLLKDGDTGHISDEECQRRFAEFTRDYLPRIHAPRETRTIAQLCDWYVEVIMPSRGYREVTQDQNRPIFRRLCEFMASHGIRSCAELAQKPGVMDNYVLARMADRAKASTIRKELGKFRAVFCAAVRRKLITEMPLTEWPAPKAKRKTPPELPDPIAIGSFLAHMDGYLYGPVVRFIAYVGCRPVDACNLTPDRVAGIDTAAPSVTFLQQKTGDPVTVHLAPAAARLVRAALERGNARVFTKPDGSPIDPNALCNAIRRHGAGAITAKSFRQSLVSSLFDAGHDQATVQSITGHRSDAVFEYRKLRHANARAAITAYADALEKAE